MTKPTLKATTKTYIEVDYGDLDNFINACFPGAEYECAVFEEWGNNTKHSIMVDGNLCCSDADDYAEFKSTLKPEQWRLRRYLNGMCADGLIPAGTYLISVYW